MRKLLLLAVILLSFAPLYGQNTCEITITGDFDSECIYDYKDEITDEYPHLMVACRNSIVTYTAHADVGTATVSGYTWEIYGDVSHTATGDHVTVTWGGDEWTLVTVTVTTSTGRTCTESVVLRQRHRGLPLGEHASQSLVEPELPHRECVHGRQGDSPCL